MYAPYYEFSNLASGIGYFGAKEWEMCLLYKWLVHFEYSREGILAILGNVFRESKGHTFAYESGYDVILEEPCTVFPRLIISNDLLSSSVAMSDTFDYWNGSLTYSQRVDLANNIDVDNWITRNQFVYSQSEGRGYGFIQFTDWRLRDILCQETLDKNIATKRPDGQARAIDRVHTFIEEDGSGDWNTTNPTLEFLPTKALREPLTTELLGRYWFTGGGWQQYYNVNNPERALCAYYTHYIERPYADTVDSAETLYNLSYYYGKYWLEYCEEYADQFDFPPETLPNYVKRRRMPIWMYPSLR